jgi:phosphate:Na+ symporter
LSGDAKEAARLIARKAVLRDMEAQATALHVRLLRDAATGARGGEGDRVGLIAEGSSLFLHVVCDLRRVHSHIAAFAYPTISRQGRPTEIAG